MQASSLIDENKSKKVRTRIFGLDFLRALAIVLVMVAHTNHLVLSERYTFGVNQYFGFIGVELFFVLSGFLIGDILLRRFYNNGLFTFKDVKQFWIRRWFRTLPTYYLVLGVAIILEWVGHHNFILSDASFFSYFFFFQNVVTPHPWFFGVAWSLSIEEWFYLLFPIVLLLVSRFLTGQKSKMILVTVGIFIAAGLLFRAGFAVHLTGWETSFRKVVFMRLDAIAIGVGLAYIKNHAITFWVQRRKLFLGLGLVLILIGSLFFLKTYIIDHQEGVVLKTIFFTWVSVSLGMLFPYFAELKFTSYKWWAQVITHISLISYSLYLIHTLVILGVMHFLPSARLGSFILIWVISIGCSTVLYYYFEHPMTMLREKFD